MICPATYDSRELCFGPYRCEVNPSDHAGKSHFNRVTGEWNDPPPPRTMTATVTALRGSPKDAICECQHPLAGHIKWTDGFRCLHGHCECQAKEFVIT
jgi:hypothetical protein